VNQLNFFEQFQNKHSAIKIWRKLMNKLQGKIALITGGTSGIGHATAVLFHQQGARVFVTGRNDQTLAEAKKTLPREVTIIKSNAASLSDMDQLLGEIKKSAGRIDILFLNAGIAAMKPFEATSEEDYDNMMDVNFKGPFFTLQKALPLLGKGSSVILTSSIAAHKGFAMMAAYSATKAAVSSLGGTLGAYLADRGIRVNSVSPGAIMTPIYGKAGLPQEAIEGMGTMITQTVPMHRFGNPEEIAKAVLFLASDDSSYLNATDMIVDGGYLAA
jgi:NAD(P)-dependent dehydrogenase (short-subunit alcohol dehydrogenase family)